MIKIFTHLDELAAGKKTGEAFQILRTEFNISPDDFPNIMNKWALSKEIKKKIALESKYFCKKLDKYL